MAVIFIGSGYVGGIFRKLNPFSIHTSRNAQQKASQDNLTGVIESKGENSLTLADSFIRLDTQEPSTWNNIKDLSVDGAVISFPADSSPAFPDFFRFLTSITEKIVIIGTTSGFKPGENTITDATEIDINNPRSMAEEKARNMGASILHSAGIYGKGRNPLDWIRKGYIKDQSKLVNLIYAGDLAAGISFILENFSPGERYVLSDGNPYPWKDIIGYALDKGYIKRDSLNTALLSGNALGENNTSAKGSVRVKPAKLFNAGFRLRHPDLHKELDFLETGNSGILRT